MYPAANGGGTRGWPWLVCHRHNRVRDHPGRRDRQPTASAQPTVFSVTLTTGGLMDLATLACVRHGPVQKNDGTAMATQVGTGGGFIPKGAKNVEVAKDFMKYFMQPKVMNENLKGGLGRLVPAIPQAVKGRPVVVQQRRTVPQALRRGSRVQSDLARVWGLHPCLGPGQRRAALGPAHADVIKNGMKVADAIDKAFKRADQIFARIAG
jgi:hypothetical protein